MSGIVNSEMIRICKFLRVPRQQVYDAWLKPETLRQWWGADVNMPCAVAEVDARVGGAYRMGMVNPKAGPDAPDQPELFVVKGHYKELDPPSRIVFSWQWEYQGDSAHVSEVTLDFFESQHEGKPATEMVLTHTKLPDGATRSDHVSGWVGCLRNLGYHFHNTWPETRSEALAKTS